MLTAGHCTYGKAASALKVVVGEHDTAVTTETPYTAVYSVASMILHPSFTSSPVLKNDISLVKTTTVIMFNEGVGLVCLPWKYNSPLESFAGKIVDVAGWGTDSYGGPISRYLKKVSLNVIANTACAGVDSSQMCTYTTGKDSCQVGRGLSSSEFHN